PPVLHGAAEAGRHWWSGGPLQAPRCQGFAPLAMPDTAVRDGELVAQRDAPVGGQAVLEGVMMRGVRTWAVAVRKPAPEDAALGALGKISVSTFPIKPRSRRRRLYRLPVIRGVVALVESLGIGLRALGISANAQLPEADPASGDGSQEISGGAW